MCLLLELTSCWLCGSKLPWHKMSFGESATGKVASGQQPLGMEPRMEWNMANHHLILEAESSPVELSGEINFEFVDV